MKNKTPPSVSSFFINLLGGICYILAIKIMLITSPDMDVVMISIISIMVAVVPIVGCELLFLKVHRRKSVGLLEKKGPVDKERLSLKLLGYYGSIALVMLGYFIIPCYANDDFFDSSFAFMLPLLIAYMTFGWVYVSEFDNRLEEPRDSLWHFGCLLAGRWQDVDREKIFAHLKSVCLRGYYIPVMSAYLALNITLLGGEQEEFTQSYIGSINEGAAFDVLQFFILTYFVFAAMDTLFAVIGYLMTFRVLDSHIRSTDSTFLGWFVCIVCYYPFWEIMMISVFFDDFYNNPEWHEWFANMPVSVIIFWGSLVIFGMSAESLTTLTFGIRFSNLTYRGLITSGPFRVSKHPQYVFKMINRFCFYVPFLSMAGLFGATQTMIMFVGICFVYYLRAKTEENHLSHYPEYVEYANWINENGIFRWVVKFAPFLKYSEEKAKAGRLF